MLLSSAPKAHSADHPLRERFLLPGKLSSDSCNSPELLCIIQAEEARLPLLVSLPRLERAAGTPDTLSRLLVLLKLEIGEPRHRKHRGLAKGRLSE